LKYKKYFRKTSLKQPGIGELFLKEIKKKNPKTFLEIGVFHGVTARNICELLHKNHKNDFEYVGVDVFDEDKKYIKEGVPVYSFNNPLKKFYFKYIKKQNPYSLNAVNDLLTKFKKNVKIIKGNSNEVLKTLVNKKFDYIFIDGGHAYETVSNDLLLSKNILSKGGTIMCDDYNLWHLGAKKAIDDFIKQQKCNYCVISERFVRIEF